MARGEGKLCYNRNSGALVYKHGGEDLVYKVSAGLETQISFAWASDAADLDICAYWDGAPNMVVGYGHSVDTSEQASGVYRITYSGDIRGTDSSEWVKVRKTVWSQGPRTFRIHFNFFGYSSAYPGSVCTVIAAQIGGQTLVKSDVACGTTPSSMAKTSDPGVVVTFDASGSLQSINTFLGRNL